MFSPPDIGPTLHPAASGPQNPTVYMKPCRRLATSSATRRCAGQSLSRIFRHYMSVAWQRLSRGYRDDDRKHTFHLEPFCVRVRSFCFSNEAASTRIHEAPSGNFPALTSWPHPKQGLQRQRYHRDRCTMQRTCRMCVVVKINGKERGARVCRMLAPVTSMDVEPRPRVPDGWALVTSPVP